MTLNKENIEEQILLFIDGELNEVAEQQLMTYIEAHPEHKALLEAYMMTQLADEEHIVFPDKELLLRKEEHIVPFKKKPVFARIAAAAVLALIAVSTVYILKNDDTDNPLTAINNKKSRVEKYVTAQQKDTSKVLAKIEPKQNKQTPTIQRQQGFKKDISSKEEVVARQKNDIDFIATQQQLAMQNVSYINAIPQEQLQVIALAEKEERGGLPQWLPIKEENLQGLNELVAKVQDLRETIQEKKAQLKSQAIVLTVAGKEFTIGNKQ